MDTRDSSLFNLAEAQECPQQFKQPGIISVDEDDYIHIGYHPIQGSNYNTTCTMGIAEVDQDTMKIPVVEDQSEMNASSHAERMIAMGKKHKKAAARYGSVNRKVRTLAIIM